MPVPSLSRRLRRGLGAAAVALAMPSAVATQDATGALADRIADFLDANPELMRPDLLRSLEAAPRVEVPPDVLEGIRFPFEERLALGGHGLVFDASGREVRLGLDEAIGIQARMAEAIAGEERAEDEDAERVAGPIGEVLAEIDGMLEEEPQGGDLAALRDLKLRAQAQLLPDERRSAYLWRADHLRAVIAEEVAIDERFRDIRERLRDLLIELAQGTDYMRACRAAGVPVPPDFVMGASDWRLQGSLSQNILDPGGTAQVWTWAPPQGRGGCVALPRGSGVAGIICQGAESGRACIWDNLRRGGGETIPWRTEPLRPREMQDATELAQNCTACHRGNNVFLVAPDDPTWCRLLRGGRPGAGCAPVSGPNAANFTLQVEAAVDALPNAGAVHPRYVPLTGTPPRPGWDNPASVDAFCGGACHLSGTGFAVTMPPLCGTSCN